MGAVNGLPSGLVSIPLTILWSKSKFYENCWAHGLYKADPIIMKLCTYHRQQCCLGISETALWLDLYQRIFTQTYSNQIWYSVDISSVRLVLRIASWRLYGSNIAASYFKSISYFENRFFPSVLGLTIRWNLEIILLKIKKQKWTVYDSHIQVTITGIIVKMNMKIICYSLCQWKNIFHLALCWIISF